MITTQTYLFKERSEKSPVIMPEDKEEAIDDKERDFELPIIRKTTWDHKD